jgi:hypothetical protein
VSWLVVAFVPGLLMLATFGLQRLESRLNRGCWGAAEVAEFLAQADAGDMTTLARDGMPEAMDCFQRRRTAHIEPSREPVSYPRAQPRRVYAAANPQFLPTRRADSV